MRWRRSKETGDPPAPAAGEAGEIREQHPQDPAWRADALAPSRHSRLGGPLREARLERGDGDREAWARAPRRHRHERSAEDVCRRICRAVLRDYAPALTLLAAPDRRRLRALTAWAATLFDLAATPGLEGDVLSAVNRWEFELEEALAGRPSGEPIFEELAREAAQRPWDGEDFARLIGLARQGVGCSAQQQPAADARVPGHDARALAAAILECFVADPGGPLLDLAEGLLRLRRLRDAHRGPLKVGPGQPDDAARIATLTAECDRIRTLLMGGARGVRSMPAELRAAALWLVYAGLAMVTDLEADPLAATRQAPPLPAGRRFSLLLRAAATERALRRRGS